ncbi:MAG: GtrA family protein [Rhodospirillaceae bacterium]|nr:GtrA family protein [Rhodospirillaceae bacterium]
MTDATVRGQFLRFAAVGTAGFAVDAGVLTLAMAGLGLGPYAARVVSFLCAATFTWAANRAFTFRGADPARPARQWARFVFANSLGAAVNYGTYAVLVAGVTLVREAPVLGVAAGSLAGLAFNFAASRKWVFGAAQDPPSRT